MFALTGLNVKRRVNTPFNAKKGFLLDAYAECNSDTDHDHS